MNTVFYVALFVAAAFFIVLGLVKKDSTEIVFSIPLLLLSLFYLTTNRRDVALSP